MKIGILGGGQLGRMLLQASANYPVATYVLENDEKCPAAHLCHHFIKGDIKDFDAVYAFGKNLDAITIEIENVNVEALEKLEAEGVRIYPKPSVLKTIKNKILQKEFYLANNIPSPEFKVTHNREELNHLIDFLPAVHKLGEGGYDGRGVQMLHIASEINKGFEAPSILEKCVDIEKEIAIIVTKNESGETAIYPAVEMIFDPALNQLDHQLCPAGIPGSILENAKQIAARLVDRFNSPGIFAVELFVTKAGEVLVNETAPRVHNSGHHTIEANYCSQFDMLWRVMLNYPLGNTEIIQPSVMINVTGAENHSGNANYRGLEEVMKIKNVFVHIYGKKQTNPGRKMGHITIMGNDISESEQKASFIKSTLNVIADS